ncbi:MAG: GspE/PulE family protein [Amphiplicatus sp.]
MSEDDLANFVAEFFELERMIEPARLLDEGLARSMMTPFMLRHRVSPLRKRGGDVVVALVDPTDDAGLNGCRFALRMPIIPVVVTASEVEDILRRLSPSVDAEEESEPLLVEDDADRLRDLASAEPAVRFCNRLISSASKSRVSDIHIEPTERGFTVRFRIDGVLLEEETLSTKQGLSAISRLKILSNLDIAERRRPQDGRFSFPVAGRSIDLRISTAPNIHGEGVVLRLLQRSDAAFDLEALGFAPEAARALRRLSDRPNGILLLTGPTGSGKTTTLYALLQRLARREIKILTIEDPVEYRIDGVSQTQVNSAIGLTFAAALRSFLRHDPDIIMVGEMRDLETARTAVQAALTGHLVLSTLHTNDAPSAITRLIDMGVEDYLVASTLIGVVGQRLVRKICNACREKLMRGIEDAPCAVCNGSGYYGRIAISETLEIDDMLRAAIKTGATTGELAAAARTCGFIEMRDEGRAKVAAGVTTEAELARVVL